MRSIFIPVALLAISWPSLCVGHPHYFASARIVATASGDGNIGPILHILKFDGFSSREIARRFDTNADAELDRDERRAMLSAVAELEEPFRFETHLLAGGREIALDRPEDIRVRWAEGQLLLTFSAKPVNSTPVRGRLGVWAEDERGATLLDFASDEDFLTIGEAFGRCTKTVVRPTQSTPDSRNQSLATEMFFEAPASSVKHTLTMPRLETVCPS